MHYWLGLQALKIQFLDSAFLVKHFHFFFGSIGCQALHGTAGSFGNILPLTTVHRHFGLASAGMETGQIGAIVFARFGNAPALFFY